MNINNIIGKGKNFEPPFSIDSDTPLGIWLIDANSKCIAMFPYDAVRIAHYICELLNRKHKCESNHGMCLRDKSKVCNLCHDCDIDVLNPGDRFA